MTADERTCAEVARVAVRIGREPLAVIHPDLPDMPAATLRRYIEDGQNTDFIRAIGAETE